MEQTNTKIFLSAVTGDNLENRLKTTLSRAGFQFGENKSNIPIEQTQCSIHFVSNKINNEELTKLANEHFKKALDLSREREHYKSFFWMPKAVNDVEDSSNLFTLGLQNNLTNNMILSTAPCAVQFVEDVRLILEEQPKKIFDTSPTDIFLICNQVDEQDALKIQTILSDIVKMVKLVIVQDNADWDYEEYASQQMGVSTISVIYYNHGSDWAIPFAQQIWKKVGGASAKSPILLFGDTHNPVNETKKFNAPRIVSMVMPLELIPLEIKMQLDKVNDNH